MSLREVTCGFVPLVDAAPLVIAQELRFAADEGISLNLVKQPSWSALRDMLALGHLDVAHMLSPMPIAMTLGVSGMQRRIDALMVLSINGTVIGVSKDLATKMRQTGWDTDFTDPAATAQAVFATQHEKLRIGVPFPFSMHRMLLEHWLAAHPGFDSSQVDIITVPPPRMAEAVADGLLDMFCVGEPWGTVALEQDVAELILPGAAIWQCAPEKVLGARHDWIASNGQTTNALMRAVYRATHWLDTPRNKPLATEILARSTHMHLPDNAIDPAIAGHITDQKGHVPTQIAHFLMFHQNAANFPWRSQAAWIGTQIARWHGLEPTAALQTAENCFRSDIYRANLGPLGVDLPGASAKVEGALTQETPVPSTNGEMILGPDAFFDGAIFDFAPSG